MTTTVPDADSKTQRIADEVARVLYAVACAGEQGITYSNLGAAVGQHQGGFAAPLRLLAARCASAGVPYLGALVLTKDTREVDADGYATVRNTVPAKERRDCHDWARSVVYSPPGTPAQYLRQLGLVRTPSC